MSRDISSYLLGVIIGTPLSTLAVTMLDIGDTQSLIITQVLIAGGCLVAYIRNIGNKTEEAQ